MDCPTCGKKLVFLFSQNKLFCPYGRDGHKYETSMTDQFKDLSSRKIVCAKTTRVRHGKSGMFEVYILYTIPDQSTYLGMIVDYQSGVIYLEEVNFEQKDLILETVFKVFDCNSVHLSGKKGESERILRK